MASPKLDKPAARVHRDATAEGGVAVAQQPLRLTLLAQAHVLVPVELQGRRQVVHLGHVHVLGADARFLVGREGDGTAEGGPAHGADGDGGVGGEVGHFNHRLGKRGVTVDTAGIDTGAESPPWRRA